MKFPVVEGEHRDTLEAGEVSAIMLLRMPGRGKGRLYNSAQEWS
jgi:hypothetical protein